MTLPISKPQDILYQILNEPSAPFREHHVLEKAKEILSLKKVPFFSDKVGNLIIGVKSQSEYAKRIKAGSRKNPLRVFVAHTDHPGFIGAEWLTQGRRLKANWHGGGPIRHIKGSRVYLATRNNGYVTNAVIDEVKLAESGRGVSELVINIENSVEKSNEKSKDSSIATTLSQTEATDLYGGYAFKAPVWTEDKTVYTKACDDLVGAAIIIETMIANNKKASNCLGILTRGEEVGYIGMIAHLENQTKLKALNCEKSQVLFISLETSRTLPGADVGKGPVLRMGDKSTAFNSAYIEYCLNACDQLFKNQVQRRIMDGGTCEATAIQSYGFQSIGFSLPLGNYHNENFQGGSDSGELGGPAPEFVHLDDFELLKKICIALGSSKPLGRHLKWDDPWLIRRNAHKGYLKKYSELIRSAP